MKLSLPVGTTYLPLGTYTLPVGTTYLLVVTNYYNIPNMWVPLADVAATSAMTWHMRPINTCAGSVRGTVVIRGWESDAMIRGSRRGAWWLLIGGKRNIAAGRDACEGILGI
ncbi:hypothetical protein Tco_1203408 [Tanacetum coccineum]